MVETWQLAADMQFFLATPFIVYAIWRWQKKGLAFLAFLILASIGAGVYIFAVYVHVSVYAETLLAGNV